MKLRLEGWSANNILFTLYLRGMLLMADKNILLVVLDSVRAKNLSIYGHHRETTPFLESLEDVTVYTQARSPSITSFESHASIYTGLYPPQHGMREYTQRLASGTTIWDQLREEYSYDTAVFSANGFASDYDYGVANGFDTVVNGGQLLRDLPFPEALDPRSHYSTGLSAIREILGADAPLKALANHAWGKASQFSWGPDIATGEDIYESQFLDWVSGKENGWAACVNFQDAHTVYLDKILAEFDRWGDERLRELYSDVGHDLREFTMGVHPWWISEAYEYLYDGAIRQAEARVERIFAALKEQGVYDDTLIVVTSDHGEAFGERSRVRDGVRLAGHGPGIHEVKTHVPLLIKAPGQSSKNVVSTLATNTEFPRVVNACLDGSLEPDGFVPEAPVVVESPGYDRRRTPDQVEEEMEKVTGTARAVYVEEDGAIEKYATWGDDEAKIEIRDAQRSRKVGDSAEGVVNEEFSKLEPQPVRQQDQEDALSDAAKERLKQFGYIE